MYQTSLASWELGTDIFKGRMIPAERFTLYFHLPNNAQLLVLTEVGWHSLFGVVELNNTGIVCSF